MVKQISDNKIYLLIKYIKSVLWRVAKRLSYIEDARCVKVKEGVVNTVNLSIGSQTRITTNKRFVLCTSKFYKLSEQICSY